jgi:membrane associated rhomboid family serine protease
MGIYDRDYISRNRRGGGGIAVLLSSAVNTIIALNVAVFIVQVCVDDPMRGHMPVTDFLAARPDRVWNLEIWRLLTACFAHSPMGIWHLVWNMLFLFFFGKELEHMYGRRDFYIFYLAAGVLSILAETVLQHFLGHGQVTIIGASGSVMAVVVLFTLFFPRREILFFFFIPAPIWVLCLVYIGSDLFGLLRQRSGGVANLAHLTGAAVGFLYWYLDLRWDRIRGLLPARRPRRARTPKVVSMVRPSRAMADSPRAPDAVSQRIDDLLGKISAEGKESLTEEEWEFLRSNSKKYRR